MKNLLLLTLIMANFIANAQLVPCRPKICVIDYSGHNDNIPNPDMTAIQNFVPDLLIDNSPGGYWNGNALPSNYTQYGTEVYSYITGGYEGTEYNSAEDNVESNLARIAIIANSGATGVFLDEVTNWPNDNDKSYITIIYNECLSRGLKLILNPGTYDFDIWLLEHCNFLISDEHYNGLRLPTASENYSLSKIIVVNREIDYATDAAEITLGAQANGFYYSYACPANYTALPSWLQNYNSLISNPTTITPQVTTTSQGLHSDYVNGNQWYNADGQAIENATGQNFIPSQNGLYYCIVNLSEGCVSGQSNTVLYDAAGLISIKDKNFIMYPNPASLMIYITQTSGYYADFTISIMDIAGKEVKKTINPGHSMYVGDLSSGVYTIKTVSRNITEISKLVISN